MRSRKELLFDLISIQGNIEEIESELRQYPWDVEKPLLMMDGTMIISVLNRCINNEIDLYTLTMWANAIECRDDLEFTNEKLQEIIFELASPEINGQITIKRLHEIIRELKSGNVSL